MKHNINLLRIFFRDVNFKETDENNLHYLYHQISLLLQVEISNLYYKKIEVLRITLGTKDLWLKYYKEENIPHYHWYAKNGSASQIFDFEKFYKLTYKDRKKYVFTSACDAIYRIAEKGKQNELKEVVSQIIQKYQNVDDLDTTYVTFEQMIDYKNETLATKVIFEFGEKTVVYFTIETTKGALHKYLLCEFDYGYIEWLITTFKKVVIQDNSIVLKGSSEIDFLPYKVDLDGII